MASSQKSLLDIETYFKTRRTHFKKRVRFLQRSDFRLFPHAGGAQEFSGSGFRKQKTENETGVPDFKGLEISDSRFQSRVGWSAMVKQQETALMMMNDLSTSGEFGVHCGALLEHSWPSYTQNIVVTCLLAQ